MSTNKTAVTGLRGAPEVYDVYAAMPDAEEWKAFTLARQRVEQGLFLVSGCHGLDDRELTAHALQVLASACDQLRSCARVLANKQTQLSAEMVAENKPEW